jgi:hypothetical protein
MDNGALVSSKEFCNKKVNKSRKARKLLQG